MNDPTRPTETSGAMHVSMLGRFEVSCDGRSVLDGVRPVGRRLLAYLLLNRGRRIDRGELAGRFWPDSADHQARTNLRRELHALRGVDAALASILATDGPDLAMDLPPGSQVDVDEVQRALRRAMDTTRTSERDAALRLGLEHFVGDLLPGYYDDWAIEARETTRCAFIDGIRAGAEAALNGDSPVIARRLFEHLVRIDPLDEAAALRLMEIHVSMNARARAVHVYHQCVSTLARELGVEPGAPLRALYARLRNDSPVDAAARAGAQAGNAGLAKPVETSPGNLIGRDAVQALVHGCWQATRQTGIRMVSIEGEAGIGKTSVARWLWAQVASERPVRAEARAFAAHGGLAFAPVLDWLRTGSLRAHLSQLPPSLLIELAQVAPELVEAATPGLAGTPSAAPGTGRRRLFEAMATAITGRSERTLLLLDDLQWADPDSLEWLGYLFHRAPGAPVLVVATLRSEEVPESGPLPELLDLLGHAGQLTRVTLDPLDIAQTGALAARLTGRDAGAVIGVPTPERIHQRSGGNPFFIEELLRARPPPPEQSAGDNASLSPRLHAVIRRRLTGTSARAQAVAAVAAAIGRTFDADILEASHVGSVDEVVDALDELWRHRLIRDVGDSAYLFIHDSVREAVYDGLSPMRRQQLHRQIAAAIQRIYADRASAFSGQLAIHQARGGLDRDAIVSFGLATRAAMDRYAYRDAIEHLHAARALLERQPNGSDRAERLVETLSGIAAVHQILGGFTIEPIARACDQIESLLPSIRSIEVKIRALQRIRIFHSDRNVRRAIEISRQSLALAETVGDAMVRTVAFHDASFVYWMRGRHAVAEQLFRRGTGELRAAIEAGELGRDRLEIRPIILFGLHAQFCWSLGDANALTSAVNEFRSCPRGHLPGFARMFPEVFDARICQFTGDIDRIGPLIDWLRNAGETDDLPFARLWAQELDGWRSCQQGDFVAGIRAQHEAIEAMKPLMSMFHPLRLAVLAETQIDFGRADEALTSIADGLAIATQTGHRFWNAELFRLRAEAQHALRAPPADVERSIRLSLGHARRHGFVTAQRRACLTRAGFRLAQGRIDEARSDVDALGREIDRRLDPRAFRALAALQSRM
ncbi:MAG: AAA family ATPase [Burkholderiaceae bacterium]